MGGGATARWGVKAIVGGGWSTGGGVNLRTALHTISKSPRHFELKD